MTQERKDQLYDEMFEWICEHINNEKDLYITLHQHFGMSKDELHAHSVENLDGYFPDEPVRDKRTLLIAKIDREYDRFLDELAEYDVANIISSAEYIATMKNVYEYIRKEYILLKDDQVEYFLKLDTPLDDICDWYIPNEVELINDLNEAIGEIVAQGLYLDEEEGIQSGEMNLC